MERPHTFSRVGIPQSHGVIITPTAGKPLSIRAERYATNWTEHWAPNRIRIIVECAHSLSRIGIPQSHCAIITPAGKRLSIWAECHAIDRTRLLGERPWGSCWSDIPQLYQIRRTRTSFPQSQPSAAAPTGEPLAIRAERDAIDHIVMSSKCLQMCPSDGIPQSD